MNCTQALLRLRNTAVLLVLHSFGVGRAEPVPATRRRRKGEAETLLYPGDGRQRVVRVTGNSTSQPCDDGGSCQPCTCQEPSLPLLINGETVPDSVLERELLQLSAGGEMDAPHAGAADPAVLRSQALRNVVARTLLLQAASAQRLSVSPAEVESERRRRWGGTSNSMCGTGVMDAIAQDLLLAKVEAYLTRHVPRPPRTAVEQFYRQHRQRYFLAEAVEAAHIVRAAATPEEHAAAEAALLQAEAELQQGKPFAQVADRFSDCKGVGGSVGWVTRGTMVQEFEDVVFRLAPGARSGLFRTLFGWHLATVKRRRSEGYRALDEVRLQIAGELFAAARRQEVQRRVQQMEAEGDIRFVEDTHHA